MEHSGLDGIRWVVEDAMKFARREAKRGNRYDGKDYNALATVWLSSGW